MAPNVRSKIFVFCDGAKNNEDQEKVDKTRKTIRERFNGNNNVSYIEQNENIGLTKSIYNQIKLSELKSASGLKKILVNLNFEDIVLMSKIKMEMDKFNHGYFEQKMVPQINERTMTIEYYGVGKWDNGQLDIGELENVKTNLKTFLMKYKWSEKILISVSPSKFWIYIQIKLK